MKKESKKSLGKLINLMILDFLMEYPDGLSEAELIDNIIQEYGLEEVRYEKGLKKETTKVANPSLKSNSAIRQSIRGQVRRALEALTELDAYLDFSREGNTRSIRFGKKYGVEITDTRPTDKNRHRKFYRMHCFGQRNQTNTLSDEELRTLMFHVRGNQTINGTQARRILNKLLKQGSSAFRQEIKHSFVGEDFLSVNDSDWDNEFIAQDYVMKNVSLLQQVIQENYRKEKSTTETPDILISFEFHAYDETLELHPSEEILGKPKRRRIVTPLKIFQDNGRFYVYVSTPNYKEKNKQIQPWLFFTYRIDLMRDMKITNQAEAKQETYIPTKEQREELRMGNIKKYLNMSFSSESRNIYFLFLRERITAIVDSFGRIKNNVKITRFSEEQRNAENIVIELEEGTHCISVWDKNNTPKKERVLCKVTCTEFGFVNWVMQYTDFALVLEPKSIVTEITKKIKLLAEQYL